MIEPWLGSLLCAILMLLLVFSGIHIAYGLIIAGVFGLVIVAGSQMAVGQLAVVAYNVTASYGFAVIPLFLLMGGLTVEAGLGEMPSLPLSYGLGVCRED